MTDKTLLDTITGVDKPGMRSGTTAATLRRPLLGAREEKCLTPEYDVLICTGAFALSLPVPGRITQKLGGCSVTGPLLWVHDQGTGWLL